LCGSPYDESRQVFERLPEKQGLHTAKRCLPTMLEILSGASCGEHQPSITPAVVQERQTSKTICTRASGMFGKQRLRNLVFLQLLQPYLHNTSRSPTQQAGTNIPSPAKAINSTKGLKQVCCFAGSSMIDTS
jgi:hypothetical protein